MHRREWLKLALCAAAPSPSFALDWCGKPGKTAQPLTYSIDYAINHLENPRYLSTVAAAPPHLLHLGHDLAFKSAAGPRDVPLPVKGANKYRRLDPSETRAFQESIRKLIRQLHDSGVRIVIPYIDNQQLGGDADRRSGFWEFYDHWDDYREFGLPPKPPLDPIHWMQTDPEGIIQFNEPKAYEAYRPQSFYAPCPNNEHWARWLEFVAEHAAQCGYDGVFVDNNILHCYCRYCRKQFQRYLRGRYTPRQLQADLGVSDASRLEMHWGADKTYWAKKQPEFREFLLKRHQPGELERRFQVKELSSLKEINEIGSGWLQARAREFIAGLQSRYSPQELEQHYGVRDFAQLGLEKLAQRLLWYETQRFWAWSIAENLLRIQRAGARYKPGFFALPNWGAMTTVANANGRRLYGKNVAEYRRASFALMFEEDGMPGRLAPGLYCDHVSQYKFAFANGARPVVLPYGAYSAANLELAMAEAGAGGGGAYVQGGYSHPEVRQRYRVFFEAHPELYAGLESLAQVGVAFLFCQTHFEHTLNLEQVYHLKPALAAGHILFDYLREQDFTRPRFERYQAILLPSVRYLADREVAALEAWVRQDGALLLTGELPGFYQNARPRPTPAFAKWFPGSGEALRIVSAGRGKIAWAHDISTLAALPQVLARLTGANLAAIDREDLPMVRVSAYWKRQGSAALLVVHLLNYGLTATEEPQPIRNIPISIPLPRGGQWSAARVQALSPGDETATDLPSEVREGRLTVRLPLLRIYRVVEARLTA
jgi:hypothetical protein